MHLAIIGGGIAGTALAHRLSERFPKLRITVYEQEEEVGCHMSRHNTGVVHRPYYLNPETKSRFASWANQSYPYWERLARDHGLPWKQVGTLTLALDDRGRGTLVRYEQWARTYGMDRHEAVLLEPEDVRRIEPMVRCAGALHCRTDTAVNFSGFTRALKREAESRGVVFALAQPIRDPRRLSADFVVVCVGGAGLRLARRAGLAREFAALYVRGEYWRVRSERTTLASRTLYTVPEHAEFPFLDPHWVVRYDGDVLIGPNAVPVGGPYAYHGVGNPFQLLCGRPLRNRWRLFQSRTFRSLAAAEWKSSLSRLAFAARVQRFLPAFRPDDLERRVFAGVRSALIDSSGRLVAEPVLLRGERSLHVLNFNSPGATGAPAFADYLADELSSTLA